MRTETFDFIPTELHASGPVGEIIVHTNPQARNVAVTLEPMTPGDKDAQKEIDKTVVKREGSRLIVKLPESPGGTTVVHSSRGGISVSGNGVIISGGNSVTMVNGQVISGGGVIQIGSGGIRAIIYVPSSIEAVLRTHAGQVQVYGDLAKLSAEASSGDIQAMGTITEADIEVSSGGISLGSVGKLEARASSGSIRVDAVTKRGRLRASSGSIHAHTDTADFRARASSGNVRITTAPGVHLDEDDVTVSSGSRRVTRR
jgi:hypothetical protein